MVCTESVHAYRGICSNESHFSFGGEFNQGGYGLSAGRRNHMLNEQGRYCWNIRFM